MKKLLLLSIVLFLFSNTKAQSPIFSKAFIGGNAASVNTCLGLPGGSWVLAGQGHACFGYPNMLKLNAQGDTVWTANQLLTAWISDLHYADGKVYCAGRLQCVCVVKNKIECSGGCGFANFGVAVQVVDTNGTIATTSGVLYGNYQPGVSGYDPDAPLHVLAIDSSHVLLSYADSLICFNPTIANIDQQWLVSWRIPVQGNINNMATNGTYIYLATDSGTQKIDTTGHWLATEPHTGVVGVYTAVDRDVYALAGGDMLRMDGNLQMLDSTSISLNHYNIQGIRSNGTDLVVLLQTDNSLSHVAVVMDTALVSQQVITLLNQCGPAVDFDVNDSLLLVAGNDSIHMSTLLGFPNFPNNDMTNSIYATTYGLQGAMPAQPLQGNFYNSTIDSAYVLNNNYFPVLYINYAVYFANTSADTVHSVSLATDQGAAIYDCAQGPDGMVFNNLHVAPGDSIKLSGLNFFYPELDGVASTIRQRFYLTAINGNRVGGTCSIDSIASPGYFYNGIETPASNGISVYPNPTNDAFTITLQTGNNQPAQLTLTDLSGRQLLQQTFTQPQQTIDIGNLSSGIYIYAIKYPNGQRVVGRISKL